MDTPATTIHSVEIEQSILASLICDRACFEQFSPRITTDHFYVSEHRSIYRHMVDHQCTDLQILCAAFPDSDIGVWFESIATGPNVAPKIEKLKDLAHRRALARLALEMLADAADLHKPAGDTGRTAQEQIKQSEPAGEASASVYVPTWDNCPADTAPLIELNSSRVLSRGNVSLLTASAGAGKTNVLGAACASLIGPLTDSLGLTVKAKSVLLIDTEQTRLQHNIGWQRFLRRAGYGRDEMPKENPVRWESIRGIERLPDRLVYLWSKIDVEDAPEVVLLDGVGDFVADPNDSDECTTLIYRICAIVDRRGSGVLMTLHNNPLTEKARGVLGSELWRKAECTLIIKPVPNNPELRCLTNAYSMGKNRSASDQLSTYFTWDNTKRMHVTAGTPTAPKGKTSIETAKMAELMQGKAVWSHGEIVALIMKESGRTRATAISRIKDMLAIGALTKNDTGTYSPVVPEKEDEPGDDWRQR